MQPDRVLGPTILCVFVSVSVFCVSASEVTHSPQVQTSPTRTVTSDLLSATLAEAATQLSFAAFLERCISVQVRCPCGGPFFLVLKIDF